MKTIADIDGRHSFVILQDPQCDLKLMQWKPIGPHKWGSSIMVSKEYVPALIKELAGTLDPYTVATVITQLHCVYDGKVKDAG